MTVRDQLDVLEYEIKNHKTAVKRLEKHRERLKDAARVAQQTQGKGEESCQSPMRMAA